MGANSKIEWTDATWNPLRGIKGKWHCTHVSEGCRNCYAERMNIRFGGPAYKPGADEFRLDERILLDPLRWKRPRKIFVCSMTDLFHEDVSYQWIADILAVMALSQRHTFQVLTKRPGRMRTFFTGIGRTQRTDLLVHSFFNHYGAHPTCDTGWVIPLPNVWLGVSVEDQKTADERIPLLLQTTAAVRWVSYEPALGPVDFREFLDGDELTRAVIHHLRTGHLCGSGYCSDCHATWHESVTPREALDWIVLGGESGPGARPMHPDWACNARDQCQAAGVPFFFKQWGEWAPTLVGDFRVGKKAAGRLLDGREWNEFPTRC